MTDRARARLARLLAYCDAYPEDANPEAVAWLRAQGEAAGIVRPITDSGCTITAHGYCMGVSSKDAAAPTERGTP